MNIRFNFTKIILIGSFFFTSFLVLFPFIDKVGEPQEIHDLSPIINDNRDSHPKMESVLYQLMKTYFDQGKEVAERFAERRGIDIENGAIRVVAQVILAYEENEFFNDEGELKNFCELENQVYLVKKQIEAMGGIVETSYKHLIQSMIPISAIQNIVDYPYIEYLRLPKKPYPCIMSEGVEKTGASHWHSLVPYRTDEKVKVCVLDVGFKGYKALLGTELPAMVETKSFRADGKLNPSEHGTACAEIVHDMAPNANLWLVNFETDVEHHNAVDWIINEGIDIVSYSIGWANMGAGDGTGPICEDVKKVHDNGIIWVSAAGNDADSHWEGNFRDPDSDRWCNFEKAGQEVSEWFAFYVYKGDTYSVLLNWDDWGNWSGKYYSGSQRNDYDLYLYGPGPYYPLYGKSENNQTAGVWPVEGVEFVAGNAGWRYICVYKYKSRRNCKLELFFWNGYRLEHKSPNGSLNIPADSQYALAVGATDSSDDSYHNYSSRGPTSDKRVKPDLCAPSGVSCYTYGRLGFYGTSAATPHVAGAFALIKEKIPFSLDQIKEILEARALDLGTSGKDNKFGFGRLKLTK